MTEVVKPTRKRRTRKAEPEVAQEAAPAPQPTQHNPNRKDLGNGLVVVHH